MIKRFTLTATLVLAIPFFLVACGSSGSSGGNQITGALSTPAPSTIFCDDILIPCTADTVNGDAYVGATVELRDANGNVVATDTADANGVFHFASVAEGDYTIVVIDPDTGLEVTTLDISVVDGDNVIVAGTVSGSSTAWNIDYQANDGLQNEAQNEKAVAIAEAAGVSVDVVLEMRASGMGWGEIAQALGVHPSVLGAKNGFDKEKHTANDQNANCSNGNGNGNNGNGNGNGNNGNGKNKTACN